MDQNNNPIEQTNYKAIQVSDKDGVLQGFAVQPKEDCPHWDINQLENITAYAEQVEQKLFSIPCKNCENVKENWICLSCKDIFCSRYVQGHMVQHNEITSHPVAVSLADLSVWCYKCESYIASSLISKFQRFLSKIKFEHEDGELGSQLKDIVETFTNLKISDEEFTHDAFIKGLKDKKFKKICVLAGAGISVAAGIPDFRSPGTGLYDNIKQFDLPYPEALFEINYFKQNPQAFYTIAKEFMLGLEAKPVLAHKFLKMLQDREQLALCFTQNIDGLELDAGLKEEKLIQAHGHMRTAHCLECREEASIKDFKKKLEKSEIHYCEKCKKGLVKPDVVFFGEGLPKEFFCNWDQLKSADLLIVMGTSLKVMPFAMSLQLVGKDVPIVVLNRENVVPDRKKVLHFPGDIEPNVQKIMDLLK